MASRRGKGRFPTGIQHPGGRVPYAGCDSRLGRAEEDDAALAGRVVQIFADGSVLIPDLRGHHIDRLPHPLPGLATISLGNLPASAGLVE